jgi:hypothetical protein
MTTKEKLDEGTIVGFSGSWGSGLGMLHIKKKNGSVISIPCDNAPTIRSLEDAYGNVIDEGHSVKQKAGFIGKKIKYKMSDWGTMEYFVPVGR